MFIIFSVIFIVLFVGADQAIKYWAVNSLAEKKTMPFIKIGNRRIIDLTYLENDGALFGSFGGFRWILIFVTSILMLVCIYFLFRYKNKSRLFTVSLLLIISGGIGNLIDRIFNNGLVIDYIELKFINFAIFNFADCCVTIGVALMFIYVIFLENREKKSKKDSNECVN